MESTNVKAKFLSLSDVYETLDTASSERDALVTVVEHMRATHGVDSTEWCDALAAYAEAAENVAHLRKQAAKFK